MVITVNTLLTASAVLGAVTGFVTLFWKLFKWIEHQKGQDAKIIELKEDVKKLREAHNEDIKKLRREHSEDKTAIQEEQTLVMYGLLACLKGLQAQGCNGPVSDAIDRIEKYINQKAHGKDCQGLQN